MSESRTIAAVSGDAVVRACHQKDAPTSASAEAADARAVVRTGRRRTRSHDIGLDQPNDRRPCGLASMANDQSAPRGASTLMVYRAQISVSLSRSKKT
jgi:hypothetical protein